MSTEKLAYTLTIIYSIVIGIFLLRLALGPQTVTIYASLIWVLLYPVILLRYLNTTIVFIILYLVFWSYIIIKNIFVYKYAALSTCLWTAVWIVLVAAPFIPFGIQYFSLLRYSIYVYSNAARIMPFIGLLAVLVMANYLYFRQRLSTSILWAMGLSMAIILMITLSDLLPALTNRPFFYVLQYRVSFINAVIIRVPIIAQLLLIGSSCFVLVSLDKNFIAETRRKGMAFRLVLPSIVTSMLMVFIAFLQNDYSRYRNFDYSKGLTTIFLTSYEDQEIIWFDRRQVRLWAGDFKWLYPFGKYDLADTLQQHAKELGSMTIIEGMHLYKLQRILKLLAYCPRDTVAYNALCHIIEQRVYRVPAYLAPLLAGVRERFTEENKEIMVKGWVIFNGVPWRNIVFCINRWFEDKSKILHFDRVWKDTTDVNGRFEFSCFGGDDLSTLYFQIYFMVPALNRSNGFDYIKILNIPHEIRTPGTYVLDTIKIELEPSVIAQDLREIIIDPSVPLDSFELSLPDMGYGKSVAINGIVSKYGRLVARDIAVQYLVDGAKDYRFEQGLKAKIRTWRFFGSGDEQTIKIYINPQRPPLL